MMDDQEQEGGVGGRDGMVIMMNHRWEREVIPGGILI